MVLKIKPFLKGLSHIVWVHCYIEQSYVTYLSVQAAEYPLLLRQPHTRVYQVNCAKAWRWTTLEASAYCTWRCSMCVLMCQDPSARVCVCVSYAFELWCACICCLARGLCPLIGVPASQLRERERKTRSEASRGVRTGTKPKENKG